MDHDLFPGAQIECTTMDAGLHGIRYTWSRYNRPTKLQICVNQGWRNAWIEERDGARYLLCYEMPNGHEYYHEWIAKPEWPFYQFVQTVNAKRPPARWKWYFAERAARHRPMTCKSLKVLHSYDGSPVRLWCLRYWCEAHCATCDPTRVPTLGSTPNKSPDRPDGALEFKCLGCTLPECDDTDPRCPFAARFNENKDRIARSRHSQRKKCPVCGKFILDASRTCVSHTWYAERALDQVAQEAQALRADPRGFISAWWEGENEQ